MLELKNIKKDYPAGDDAVHALKGISSKFRENEFVCILGPSGCGKTTMLNIIGGLDQYTEGDLIINGKSTRDFTDREWDSYRNESIGFVFQNYNLIPHQTVLQNVELALTLSGVSREERRDRATKVLNDVGLGDQLNKRPNELSGGQMQRVAIARALVNNPDIILADEPTGALDTTTSVQVMDVLKDISEDRLVIMVTHNASLADRYASRIIRMLDGQITDDNVPFTDDEYHFAQAKDQKKNEKTAKKRKKKTSMSLGTSFSLSLKNLMTKKGRTILTSFAGSIGIIGIALILALSQGFTAYIDYVQENTLSSYPLTIESSVADLGSLMDTVIKAKDKKPNHKLDAV
ncbi:MAG TPA: ABC transporter, partial [Clostridiales bacterium]|nr:ABC transporter [Clostridiales bacterium]